MRAADLALRRLLRSRETRGALVILDTTGRGAAILDKTNMADLHHRPVIWYDLADRQRPVALFKLGHSEHLTESTR